MLLLPLAPSTFIKTPGWMDGWMDGMITFPYESELDFKVLIKAFFFIKICFLTNFLVMKMI
jgi:hypothetical protein